MGFNLQCVLLATPTRPTRPCAACDMEELFCLFGQTPLAMLVLICTLQRFSVLGSTGSIGTQTLDIMEEFPDKFKLVALAAGSNVKLLAEQVRHAARTPVRAPRVVRLACS